MHDLPTVELGAVRPDAADAGDFTLAERDGEVAIVAVLGRNARRARAPPMPFPDPPPLDDVTISSSNGVAQITCPPRRTRP